MIYDFTKFGWPAAVDLRAQNSGCNVQANSEQTAEHTAPLPDLEDKKECQSCKNCCSR